MLSIKLWVVCSRYFSPLGLATDAIPIERNPLKRNRKYKLKCSDYKKRMSDLKSFGIPVTRKQKSNVLDTCCNRTFTLSAKYFSRTMDAISKRRCGRLLAVPFRSVDRASLSRIKTSSARLERANEPRGTWGRGPAGFAARRSRNGALRPCFRIAMNPTNIKRLLAV